MSPTHYAVPRGAGGGGNGGGTSLRLPDFNQEKTDMGTNLISKLVIQFLMQLLIHDSFLDSSLNLNCFSYTPTCVHELLRRGEDEGPGNFRYPGRRRPQDADRGGAGISGSQGGEHTNTASYYGKHH